MRFVGTMAPSHRMLALALAATLAGCPSAPAGQDASAPANDAFLAEDAAYDDGGPTDDAYACPARSPGRWVIGPFTYSGPDCTAMSSIDLEYHPVAFTVGADGTVTGCECDTAGDPCEVSLGEYDPHPPCLLRLACRGNPMNVYFESTTMARVIDHRLASGFGTCMGSGPFTHE